MTCGRPSTTSGAVSGAGLPPAVSAGADSAPVLQGGAGDGMSGRRGQRRGERRGPAVGSGGEHGADREDPERRAALAGWV